jgi:hypothetical protein
MSNIMGKLILISPQKINKMEHTDLNFIPEDTDFIQDHKTFENRRQYLIDEFEKELHKFRNNSMKVI